MRNFRVRIFRLLVLRREHNVSIVCDAVRLTLSGLSRKRIFRSPGQAKFRRNRTGINGGFK